MYMLQHYDKARQRLLEIRARDDRVMMSAPTSPIHENPESKDEQITDSKTSKSISEEKTSVKVSKSKESKMIAFEDEDEDEDDLF